ncbi:SGNH/GDSL hydrolase family protein [Conchiformibius kuhniae]|uniref:SGNH/GDSL hydrolase family protein n=1 Tax=Conchiformibius kuhniae TaxID=211502 RepID=A0A8T9MYU6_9NEIS|nr:SGNH/GDSL hydrolase family protein [Conchiformibius kuhniae]UOP05576.1 SGNH/GDSL hydrolase family protein [Conchiformibius kuhniae]
MTTIKSGKLRLLALLLAGALSGTAALAQTPVAKLHNYAGEDASDAWQQKLRLLNEGGDTVFRVVQLGDSHTAGAFFTDELRRRLQQRWGDGGIGWVFPQQPKGQRDTQIRYRGGWLGLNARKDRADFPLGGVLARSQAGQTLSLHPAETVISPQRITFAMRPVSGGGALSVRDGDDNITAAYGLHGKVWQYFALDAVLPVHFATQNGDVWEIGAVGIENGKRGAVVSALGLNGAQFGQWSAWRQDWGADLAETRADLVILAYGTNEAFNAAFDPAAAEKQWRDTVRRIRTALPEAAILMVGAPESLKSRQGKCGVRPPKLDAVQMMQQRVAENEGLLYWSWQQAMGGACSMNDWVKQGLAAKDGVHFSAEGYRRAAAVLANALMGLAE